MTNLYLPCFFLRIFPFYILYFFLHVVNVFDCLDNIMQIKNLFSLCFWNFLLNCNVKVELTQLKNFSTIGFYSDCLSFDFLASFKRAFFFSISDSLSHYVTPTYPSVIKIPLKFFRNFLPLKFHFLLQTESYFFTHMIFCYI